MTNIAVEISEDINEICKPLFSNTEISYFAHTHLTTDQEVVGVASDRNFMELYYDNEYYNNDIHMLKLNKRIRYIYWDLMERSGKTKQMHLDFASCGNAHTFTIIEHNKDSKDCFYFATNNNNDNINTKYAQYTEFLEKFILYFKDKVSSRRCLKDVYNQKYAIDDKNSGYHVSNIDLNSNLLTLDGIKANSYSLSPNGSRLSIREIECLYWLEQGKTMQETANILNITHRTVKAHIESCKKKLDCYNLFQLGKYYNEYKVSKILEK